MADQNFSIKATLRGYDDLFDRILDSIPEGKFYDDFSKPIVPWVSRPINFILNSDNFGVPIRVTVERTGDYHPNVDNQNLIGEATIVPENLQTNFALTLGRGINRVVAEEQVLGGRVFYYEVIATSNTLILEPMARQINVADSLYESQLQALSSKFSTRLLDQVITFSNLLVDLQAVKILTTKLLLRGAVHFPARDVGIRNLIEAFSINTPHFKKQRDFKPFGVETSKILRAPEITAGEEAHVWFPNLSVARAQAFTKMADSFRNNYLLKHVTDDTVILDYKGSEQRHLFDYNAAGANFLTNLSVSDCFNNIDMTFGIGFILNYRFCVWTYAFDQFITDQNLIGIARGSLDLDIPFDSNLPFDGDPIDPFSDGFLGWSLSGRFDFDDHLTLELDSHVVPSIEWTGDACSYDKGPYTQFLNTINTEIPVEENVTVLSGSWDDTYTQMPIVGVGLTLPNESFMVAGQDYLAAVKFVDQNGMTNSTGNGLIRIEESQAGDIDEIQVNTGFQFFLLRATKTGNIFWNLSSGSLVGVSDTIEVKPGPFFGFAITMDSDPFAVGVPFNVSIQTIDQYGNNQPDYGLNNVVQIDVAIGFPPNSFAPPNVTLDPTGFATVQITPSVSGSGALRFTLGSQQTDTPAFTVNP